MDGWMDGVMDGWVDGCMDGWMDGWMDAWSVFFNSVKVDGEAVLEQLVG